MQIVAAADMGFAPDEGRLHIGVDLLFQLAGRAALVQEKVGDIICRPPDLFPRGRQVHKIEDAVELNLGVAGWVLDDGGDPVIFCVVDSKRFADDVRRTEIFLGGGGAENDIILAFEGGGVTFYKRKGEDRKKG
jgi:hypothetical protein